MGQTFTDWIRTIFFGGVNIKTLLVGLDNAGKSSILYKLQLGENIATVPTIGFNVELIQYRNIDFVMWDIGGQDKIRQLWVHYYQGVKVVIFVIDSNDVERIEQASGELKRMMSNDQLKDVKLLVLANKQDLPNALDIQEITRKLNLEELKQKEWFIQPCSVLEDTGLFEGLDWISNAL